MQDFAPFTQSFWGKWCRILHFEQTHCLLWWSLNDKICSFSFLAQSGLQWWTGLDI
jgi:hypothetical protein